MEPFPISGLLLRRAVLGTLLSAGGPLSPAEIAAALEAAGATTSPERTKGPSRLIAYQVRIGKVVKVGPGLFAAAPERISRSTRQRCLGWRRQFEQRVADDEAWLAEHPEDAGEAGTAGTTPAPVCPSPPPSDAHDPAGRPRADPPICPGPPLSDAHEHGGDASERGGLGATTAAASTAAIVTAGVASEGGGLGETSDARQRTVG